jgi:hypothetical protein
MYYQKNIVKYQENSWQFEVYEVIITKDSYEDRLTNPCFTFAHHIIDEYPNFGVL